MKSRNVEIVKWVSVLLGIAVFILVCLVGAWMFAIATLPKSETVTIAELGTATNRVLRTVTVPFQSSEYISLQWSWEVPTNQLPDIHVVCDLSNEAKEPVYFTINNGADIDNAKIESGRSTNFFDGNLADLVFATKVYFQTETRDKAKKLKLRMRFDKEITLEPPVKVQLFINRPVL